MRINKVLFIILVYILLVHNGRIKCTDISIANSKNITKNKIEFDNTFFFLRMSFYFVSAVNIKKKLKPV